MRRKNKIEITVEGMEFPGALKKEHVDIPEVNLKRSGISRGVPEKLMWNFHETWFLTLEYSTGVTQFC